MSVEFELNDKKDKEISKWNVTDNSYSLTSIV